MAIALRDTSSAVTPSAATSITVNVPALVVDGDLMLLWALNSDSSDPADFTNPSGWSSRLVDNLQTGGSAPSAPGMTIWWRIASSEPASYTIQTSPSAANGLVAFIYAFSGVDATTPIDVTTTTATGDSTNADPPSITPITDGAWTVFGCWWDANTSRGASAPTNYTDSTEGELIGLGGGNGCTTQFFHRTSAIDPAAPENPGNVGSTAEQWGTATVALRPGVTAGITGVTPTTFDFDNADLDIEGANFEASQGTGTVYISDADTLAGSVNEVEIDTAINTWADDLINLDFSGMNATQLGNLETLGPGTRYLIVVNNSSDEYGSEVLTTHRAKAIFLADSTNIAAGGANTTYQLTPPATKTGADNFGGGRIQDDENPADTVDLGTDEYGEWEWALAALDPPDGTYLGAQDAETYEFRIVTGVSTLLDTYSETPEWLIGQAGPTFPTITSIDGDNVILFGQSADVLGADFGAPQGTGRVDFCAAATYGSPVAQGISSWADGVITIATVQGALVAGVNYLFVENDSGLRNPTGFAFTASEPASSDGLYIEGSIQTTITSSGLTTTAFLVRDE